MSEMEAYTGKLKPTGKTVAEVMEGYDFPSYYDKSNPSDVEDYFVDKFYEERVAIDGFVFDVEMTAFEEGDMFNADKNEDGTIDFVVRYYNGGCSFSEAIDRAIERIDTTMETT